MLAELRGCDIALIDLIGKALNRPAAMLFGNNVRDSVQAYDGSVYMEDLLEPQQCEGLIYIKDAKVVNPVEMVVRKAYGS